MCVDTCVINGKTPNGKVYPRFFMTGEIYNGKESPNHHFVPMEGENQGKDVYDILKDRLEEMGCYVDESWTVPQLQKLIAEKRQEETFDNESEVAKKVLDKYKIKYHHRLGAKKLMRLIRDNDLEEEFKEERELSIGE
jgi:hypothetical protein